MPPGRPARFVARRLGPLDVRGWCRQGCRGRNHRALPRLGDRGQRETGRGADDGGPGRRIRRVRGLRLAPRAAGIGRGLRDRGLRRAGRPRGSRQRQRRLRFTNSAERDSRGCRRRAGCRRSGTDRIVLVRIGGHAPAQRRSRLVAGAGVPRRARRVERAPTRTRGRPVGRGTPPSSAGGVGRASGHPPRHRRGDGDRGCRGYARPNERRRGLSRCADVP